MFGSMCVLRLRNKSGGPLTTGAEKSGKNAQGDTWWETWQEVLKVDELR